MNIIPTYIKESKIHGIGLFANDFIKEGTLIWKLSKLDIVLDSVEYSKLSLIEKQYIEIYGFCKNNTYILCSDEAKYCNHSDNANTICNCFEQYAKRDIEKDEEITCNYQEIDDVFKL